MAERYVVIDKLRITYEGLFNVTDLYKTIDNWLREKGYDKCEVRNIEKVTPNGKFIEMELRPWKKITDYAKNEIRMRMIMTDIKEVDVEKDGAKVRLNQGKIQIVFDGFTSTDYENRWESKPFFFFMRAIIDKYVYRSYTEGYKANVLRDVNHLHSTIKSFLNLYRYATPTVGEAYVGETYGF